MFPRVVFWSILRKMEILGAEWGEGVRGGCQPSVTSCPVTGVPGPHVCLAGSGSHPVVYSHQIINLQTSTGTEKGPEGREPGKSLFTWFSWFRQSSLQLQDPGCASSCASDHVIVLSLAPLSSAVSDMLSQLPWLSSFQSDAMVSILLFPFSLSLSLSKSLYLVLVRFWECN